MCIGLKHRERFCEVLRYLSTLLVNTEQILLNFILRLFICAAILHQSSADAAACQSHCKCTLYYGRVTSFRILFTLYDSNFTMLTNMWQNARYYAEFA